MDVEDVTYVRQVERGCFGLVHHERLNAHPVAM